VTPVALRAEEDLGASFHEARAVLPDGRRGRRVLVWAAELTEQSSDGAVCREAEKWRWLY
jgi:hypothetical protein